MTFRNALGPQLALTGHGTAAASNGDWRALRDTSDNAGDTRDTTTTTTAAHAAAEPGTGAHMTATCAVSGAADGHTACSHPNLESPQNHYQTLGNRQHGPAHLHRRPNAKSVYASDASTPSRTRSTSSSTSAPLSTFPSSTSPAHVAADGDNTVRKTQPELTAAAATAAAAAAAAAVDTNTVENNDDGDGDSVVHDHVPHARPHQPDLSRPQDSAAPLSVTSSPQPHASLLACSSTFLRDRVQRSGRQSSANHCLGHNHSRSHSRRPSQEDNRDSRAAARKPARRSADLSTSAHRDLGHVVCRSRSTKKKNDGNDGRNNGGSNRSGSGSGAEERAGAEDAESLDSHALAWDQTCLRIAYLVSTMVTPSASPSVGGGDAEEGSAAAGAAGGGTVGGAVGGRSGNAGETAELGEPSPDVLEFYSQQAPKGWVGADPAKKRRRIAQILYWQGEIRRSGDRVYCGCPAGSPIPEDSPLLVAAVGSDSKPASASAPASAPAPAPVPVSAPVAGVMPGSVGLTAGPDSLCPDCGRLLTPQRRVVPVDDPNDKSEDAFNKPRGSQEGTGKGLKKVFKGFRCIFPLKKKKRVEPSVGPPTHGEPSAARQPSPPEAAAATLGAPIRESKAAVKRRVWDQWEKLNCTQLREEGKAAIELFFPQTGMYNTEAKAVDEAHAQQGTQAPASIPTSALASARPAHGLAVRVLPPPDMPPPANGSNNGDAGNYEGDESDDSGAAPDPEARERRRKREMQARLQRAQNLLAQQNANDASPTTNGN